MNTKLTLRLDDSLIKSAKAYSASIGKPVSKMVADYFEMIKNEKLGNTYSISPTVAALKGILNKSDFSEVDYKKYLEKKYL